MHFDPWPVKFLYVFFLAGGFVTHDTLTVTTDDTLTQDRVTIQEACKIANVSRKTLYRWIEKGLLSREKDENRAYVSLAEVRALCVKGDSQQVTESVSGDDTVTRQVTQVDTNKVTVDRVHYDGLLVRLGQLEAEKRYLLEYKIGLESQTQELATVKSALATNSAELDQARAVISKARAELERMAELKQMAERTRKEAEANDMAILDQQSELDRLRAENERLRLPFWRRWLKK
ncbi:MAG: hypothetical protein QG610_641 [Euryarchaeota archaeon]|nr:hypothetical protein [Euryarchaeota archaeon]